MNEGGEWEGKAKRDAQIASWLVSTYTTQQELLEK